MSLVGCEGRDAWRIQAQKSNNAQCQKFSKGQMAMYKGLNNARHKLFRSLLEIVITERTRARESAYPRSNKDKVSLR